jgi:hypothetical protein
MATKNPRREEHDAGPIRSRRGLLAGAAGAVGAIAAGTVAAATPAQASTGDSVILGEITSAEQSTVVLYDGVSGNAAGAVLIGMDASLNALSAGLPAGVGGVAGAGATAGKAGFKNGVSGYTDNGAGNGTVGWNSNAVPGAGTGVLGIFGGTFPGHTVGTAVAGVNDSTTADATAVYGEIASTSPGSFSAAVRGQNNGTGGLGVGVWGSQAGSGWGVYGTAASGIGVFGTGGSGTGAFGEGATGVHGNGTSATGVGILAENTAGGTALHVNGTASFTRSGTVTVSPGHSSTTNTGIALTSASLVLATIQGNVAGLYVQGVTMVAGPSGSFTIHLSKSAPANTKVAWFVVN